MTILRRSLLLLLPIGMAGCASTWPPRSDLMCDEIARFANSSSDHALHTVELETDWSGRFVADPDVLAAKNCTHNTYPPGVALCNYLMKNTSTEFAVINFKRALTCLEGASQYGGGTKATDVKYLHGKVSSYAARHAEEDVRVDLEFSTGSDEAPPILKISAQRLRGE